MRLRQEEKTQLTRARLKESALRSFAQKGVSCTGIEEIARGAGYSRGAFYGNYASKFDILIDALDEKQMGEVRLWRKVMETAGDPDAGLASLTERYEDLPLTLERTLLSVELQLEADRNPEFRPVFKRYLDNLYDEMRAFFITALERNGKAAPKNMDSILVTSRLLGLGLGSQTILGGAIGERTKPSEIMLEFLRGVIDAAPPLSGTTEHDTSQ